MRFAVWAMLVVAAVMLGRGADAPSLPEHFQKVTARVYSGGEPTTEAHFRQLKFMGIRTVVSVDGTRPNLEAAQAQGLRYVHVPFGYDQIPRAAQLALARVLQESPEPIYIHCHHGLHRGPAAVAVACQAEGSMTAEEAIQFLTRAGTSLDYTGLWRDVREFQPVQPGEPLPKLVAVAEVESLTSAMALMDRRLDDVVLLQKSDWHPPTTHPDLDPKTSALLLWEAIKESSRLLTPDQAEGFGTEMASVAEQAESLREAISQGHRLDADRALGVLRQSCRDCHRRHRDK